MQTLRMQSAEGFSYTETGHTLRDVFPSGYEHDRNEVCVGKGQEDFLRAGEALAAWEMFPQGWCRILPKGMPQTEGTTVIMAARAFGLWWISAARVVYVLAAHAPGLRAHAGFAYGTLPGHVECGEEQFAIEWREDDSVWYTLKAFSRPRLWIVRLAKPLARALQRRFVSDSKLAMVQAVAKRRP